MLNVRLIDDLLYWMTEREAVRVAKESGKPKPWTEDPILQSFRFCNVRREHDKVTQWFARNWRSAKYQNEPNFVPAMIFGRTINWPDTLEEIGYPYKWDRQLMVDLLDRRQRRGDKVYTGAYMITAGPTGVSKNEWVCRNADTYFNSPPRLDPTSLEVSWKQLMVYPCVGPFIAGQIIADLKQTPVLASAEDWFNWAALGPGSMRGLNRLYERKLNASITQEQGLAEMREVQSVVRSNSTFYLCLQDLQNCLCEFDKYERVKWGQGKPRSSYPGRA